MTSAFNAALAFLKPAEGGYSNTPGDSGGPTNFGITLATLSAWRATTCTAADVQALTWAEAESIYAALYWNPVQGDLLPGGVALSVFDEGVNAGVSASTRQLQTILGVTADGWIGPQTIASLTKWDDISAAKKLTKPALKVLQGAVGVKQDSDLGPLTLAAIQAHPAQMVLCAALYDAQAAYYMGLNDPEFESGWMNRCLARYQAALAVAATAAADA